MLAITDRDVERFALCLQAIVRLPFRCIAMIWRHQRHRRTYRQMLYMNDAQLKDIGLTRESIYHLLSQPASWDDVN